MRRYIFLIILTITACLSAKAFTLTIISDSKPLEGALVTAFTNGMDSITSAISDIEGKVSFDSPEIEILKVSKSGLAARLVRKSDLKDYTVDMTPAVDLQEVKVVASGKTSFLTHDSYRIPLADMKRYPTVFQALNEIPFIDVLPGGQLFFLGNENIAILLNGVDSSREEIATLAKEDILKVDVYRNPPHRFASSGVVSVIDIVTKKQPHRRKRLGKHQPVAISRMGGKHLGYVLQLQTQPLFRIL